MRCFGYVLGGIVVGITNSWRGALATLVSGPDAGGLTPVEDLSIFTGGDHYVFAYYGVPSVSFYSGTLQPYYHTQKDEFGVVQPDYAARVAQYAGALVRAIANGGVPSRRVGSGRYAPRLPAAAVAR